MEINFTDIVNKHFDKSCLIVGPGPTMANFPYQKFKGVIISIGDSAIRGKDLFTPDYWVCSNSHFPVPEIDFHLKIINSFTNTTFLFAQTELYAFLWKKSQNYLDNNLKVNWLMFDERHISGAPCLPKKNCCNLISNKEGFFTIQELVTKIYKHDNVAKQAGTVFEYAICLSLILGCKTIYIQGVDLPFQVKKKSTINYLKILSNFNKKLLNFFNYSNHPKKIENNFFVQGDYGQQYYTNENFKKEIEDLYKKTIQIIEKKALKVSVRNYLFFIVRIKNFFNKFLKYILENEKNVQKKHGYHEVINDIFYNLNIYSDISYKNNKIFFYLSPKSNLSKVKNFTFIDPKDLIIKDF